MQSGVSEGQRKVDANTSLSDMTEGRRLESVPEEASLRITKAEPVTASQQMMRWLMRASTQDIRTIFRTRRDSLKPGVLRKCETDVTFRIESDQEEEFEQQHSESPRTSLRKKRKKIKPRGSRNQSNDSLMKHFSIKGMVSKSQFF